MKPWQNGYELDELKRISKIWEPHRSKCITPFGDMRQRMIAGLLGQDQLVIEDGCSYVKKFAKTDQAIKIYSNKSDATLAYKSKGDVEILYPIINDPKAFRKHLSTFKTNTWLTCLEDFAEEMLQYGFDRIGSKYTSFGDCFAVLYLGGKDAGDLFGLMSGPNVVYTDPLERVGAFQFKDYSFDVSSIAEKIAEFNFSNHYSNYNDGGWSALSLRGFDSDPLFITKPEEMNDKWKEENKDKEFFLQDTPIYDMYFPEVRAMVSTLPNAEIHRVRLMKLSSGKVIGQHTDLVDPDVGVNIDQVPRFHIPIITEDCHFDVWDMEGKKTYNMKAGELWYLDTRKPHSVRNNGPDRFHLVFDLKMNEELRSLMGRCNDRY